MKLNEILIEFESINDSSIKSGAPGDIAENYTMGVISLFEAHIQLCEWNIDNGQLDDAMSELTDAVMDNKFSEGLSNYINGDLIKTAQPLTYLTDLKKRDEDLNYTSKSLTILSDKLKNIICKLDDKGQDVYSLKIHIGKILTEFNNRPDVRSFLSEENMRFWKRKRYDNTTSSDLFPCGVTSENISHLNPDEIFVFGSNLQGMHGGGAARAAVRKFGAIMGQGVGLQGQSYAIPTMQGGVETIRPYVDEFIEFARHNPNMHFLVTKIGCGIAGFRVIEIAPLFNKAVNLQNVSLPQEFIHIINTSILPEHTRKKIYGQTRTLVDIACEMNNEKHFTSPKEVLDALLEFVESLRDHGDEIAWTCSFRCVNASAEKCFVDGKLDIDKFQEEISDPNCLEYGEIGTIYRRYAVEKTIKIVEMLNEFRRYTNPLDLKNDLFSVIQVNHCGPNRPDYYFSFGSTSGFSYIQFFLERNMERFWSEIAPNGTLDNAKFKDLMYEHHASIIEKYGLDAVIRSNFEQDSPCHPEVYVAYRGGAAPVYVEERFYGRPQDDPCAVRTYAKSCGEGKGPNGISDYFEFNRIKRLIEEDEKYVIKADSHEHEYYCPKEDFTLPIYDSWFGKMYFLYLADKIQFMNTLYDYDGNR